MQFPRLALFVDYAVLFISGTTGALFWAMTGILAISLFAGALFVEGKKRHIILGWASLFLLLSVVVFLLRPRAKKWLKTTAPLAAVVAVEWSRECLTSLNQIAFCSLGLEAAGRPLS